MLWKTGRFISNQAAVLAWGAFTLVLLTPLNAQNPDCDCPEHPGKLTVRKTEAFDLIFLGRADSLSPCQPGSRKALAVFAVERLYKGRNIPPYVTVEYPCAGACRFEFHPGDMWLLYAHHTPSASSDIFSVHPCERNRPVPRQPSEDDYTLYNEMTFAEETLFMRKHLLPAFVLPDTSVARLAREGQVKAIDQNRSIIFATDLQKLLLLAVSLAAFMALWLLTRRWFRNP
jgi:hypothetical protein